MSEELTRWIMEYGYWAVFFGTMIEGETVAFLSGIAAHNQLLSYPLTMLAAAIGGIVSDNLLFFIGRYFGSQILPKLHNHQDKITYVQNYIKRHENWVVIGVRFAYGVRTIGPIIIGASRINPLKFFVLNLIGGVVWSCSIVSVGYFMSALILSLPVHLSLRWLIIVAVPLLILIYWKKHLFNKIKK